VQNLKVGGEADPQPRGVVNTRQLLAAHHQGENIFIALKPANRKN
jgi:hypothetical protein